MENKPFCLDLFSLRESASCAWQYEYIYSLFGLKELYVGRTKRNPRYSLRAFARDLNLSPGYLSRVFNGKKAISFERALELGRSMRLDENVEKKLLKAAALESVRDPGCRRFLESIWSESTQGDDFQILELDRFRVISEWHHIAILDLTLLAAFQSDAKWIATQLKITVPEVQTAIERLIRLGLLAENKGVWKKTNAKLLIPTNATDSAVRSYHRQMMEKAAEAMERKGDEEFDSRKIVGTTIALDSKKIGRARALVEKFRSDLTELVSSDGRPDELYQLGIQFFRLTEQALKIQDGKKE